MDTPNRIWWARPKKLCAMERPGGGGRSHRPDEMSDWKAIGRGANALLQTLLRLAG